jgi:hypothetical protein
MRGDELKIGYLLIQTPGDPPLRGISGKEPVGMQPDQGICRSHLLIVVPGVCRRNQQASPLGENS